MALDSRSEGRKKMFCVYVLKCRDGSLYTGYTSNTERRLRLHNEGKASKYTRSRLPVRIVAKWSFPSKSAAMKHESAFKSLPRKMKMERIAEAKKRLGL